MCKEPVDIILQKTHKLGFLGTTFIMAVIMVLLIVMSMGPLHDLVTGQYASLAWARSCYFIFAVISFISFLIIAVVRKMSDRRVQLVYWSFTVTTIVTCICLMIILTYPYYSLVKCVEVMGSTTRRTEGQFWGMCGYISVLGFMCWAIRPPKKHDKLDS